MYRKTAKSNFKHFDFYILDLLIFALSYVLGYLFKFNFQVQTYLTTTAIRFGIVLLIIYLLVAIISRAYKDILRRSKWTEIISVFVQVLITLVVFLLYLYFTKQSSVLPRWMFGYTAIIAFLLLCLGRLGYKQILRKHYRNNDKLPHMLVVAESGHVRACIHSITKRRFNEFYISGVVVYDRDMTGEDFEGIKVVSSREGLKDYILANVVDQIFLSVNDEKDRMELTQYFLEAGITVHISLMEDVKLLPNAATAEVGGQMVLTTSNTMAGTISLALKRLADIVGGIVGLLVTGVLYLIIAPQIKAKDPGPAFFKQIRIGKNGRQFYIYKFRSMYMDAEERKKELMARNEMQGLMFKIEDDPRILPGIGHKIRDWSLDEFPQFWNVFKGDMSLVGTRPPTLDEFTHYEAHHKSRLSFKPGITGMWQVSGRNDITDFEEIVRLDNEYIRKWNIWLDIKILFRTIKVVIQRKGSK